MFFGKDVREHGSGNAGATNVYRVLGWKPALVVVLVDVAKGFVPTYYAASLISAPIDGVWPQLVAGCAAILGHCYTVFAGFRGGKGVATGGGMMLALFPLVVPMCIAIFALVIWKTRYVSLGSLCAAGALVPLQLLSWLVFGQPFSPTLLTIALLLFLFVAFTHRTNIARLRAGTENKIS